MCGPASDVGKLAGFALSASNAIREEGRRLHGCGAPSLPISHAIENIGGPAQLGANLDRSTLASGYRRKSSSGTRRKFGIAIPPPISESGVAVFMTYRLLFRFFLG
jgi:hypothetical protein